MKSLYARIRSVIAVMLVVCMLPFSDFVPVVNAQSYQSEGVQLSTSANQMMEESSDDGESEAKQETQNIEGEAQETAKESKEETIISQEGVIASDMTLTQDLTMQSVRLENGILDLNGYTLTITEDFIQSSGQVLVNHGTLIVKGSYYIEESTDAQICMLYEDDYVTIEKDFTFATQVSHLGKLIAGTLEIKGNFIQVVTNNTKNFVATNQHLIKLTGEMGQTITVTDYASTRAQFANLEFAGSGMVSFVNAPFVSGKITDNRNYEIVGELAIGAGTSFEDGYYSGSLIIKENRTFSYPMEIGGNLTIELPITIGDMFKVHGDVLQKANVTLNEGQFYIEGALNITGNTPYNSGFIMQHSTDYVCVNGDLSYDTRSYNSKDLSDGLLEIKGNVNITSNFKPCNDFTVILSGTRQQCVKVNPSCYFQKLILKNTSQEGIYSETAIYTKDLEENQCKINYGIEGIYGDTLLEDTILEGDVVFLDGELNLNGHSLTVKGNLYQVSGKINVNSGKLYVEGDYLLTNPKESGQEFSAGILQMTQEDDYVFVGGNFETKSIAENEGKLTNGILEVKGDFIQHKMLNTANFVASKGHTLLLSGETTQKLEMQSANVGQSKIANLQIKNTSEEGITFEGNPFITGCITNAYENVQGCIRIGNTTTFKNNRFGADISTVEAITLSRNLEVKGNVTVNHELTLYQTLKIGGESVCAR